MKVFTNRDYIYRVRKPVNQKKVAVEFLDFAALLKQSVDNDGSAVLFDDLKLYSMIRGTEGKRTEILNMIKAIRPQLRLLCNHDRAINDEVIVEQMYCKLLRGGHSRNRICGFLYAVYFALGRELNLSQFETETLRGSDTFTYKKDREITVTDENIEEIEALIKRGDQNAMAELGNQIFNGNIEKYRYRDVLAQGLCRDALNHGNGKAARVLGSDSLSKAKQAWFSNDYYSKAYEYYTVYGALSNNTQIHRSHREIVDILNLGLYNRKMIFNYVVIALVLSLSFFVPNLLGRFGVLFPLHMSVSGCFFFSILEFLAVILGIVVRRLRPFFTQGWIVFLQTLIWLVGFIIIVA